MTRSPLRPPAKPAATGPAWFEDMTASCGVHFRHVSGNSPEKPFPAANGSGVAALDYDLDGRVNLYFATGTAFPLDPAPRNPSTAFIGTAAIGSSKT